MAVYMGLDVGGTKTLCLIADESGHVRGFGKAGTGNYEYNGVGAAAAENRKAVDAALNEAGLALDAIAGIGMGVAGADLPEDFAMLEREIYTPLFGNVPRAFRNDSMAALRGGTRKSYGIVLACGTGCVCAGKNRAGEEARAGGLGTEFGDQCTGKTLGEEGLRAVWRARDGITPPTALSGKFVERGGCGDVDELFYKLYRREMGHGDLEPMAELVFEAAFDRDPTACAILREGGQYLGAMANAVARKLRITSMEFDLVLAGSVFKGKSPVLADAMKSSVRQVCPDAAPVEALFEPVVGALLLGMELDLTVTEEGYAALSEALAVAETHYAIKFKAG